MEERFVVRSYGKQRKIYLPQRFLVRSYRKLETLSLILQGYDKVRLLSHLPVSRSTLYTLLRRYKMQGLIRFVKSGGMNRTMRIELTWTGVKWLRYMLDQERSLRLRSNIDTRDVDNVVKLLNELWNIYVVREQEKVLRKMSNRYSK